MPTTIEARRQTKRGRFYEVDGKLYPSVTTILSAIGKPALVAWAAKVEREMVIETSADLYQHTVDMADTNASSLTRGNWIHLLNLNLGNLKASEKQLAKAGEIGTQAHKLIENELNRRMGLPPQWIFTPSEAADRAFNHWQEWAKSVHLEPIASEQVIWSHKHRYAGTLDLLARLNGNLAVVDWKTGKYVYNEAHLQNAAYRSAVREMGHGDPVEGWIVRLPKTIEDPKFEAVAADPEAPAMEAFLHTQALWNWLEQKNSAWEAASGL